MPRTQPKRKQHKHHQIPTKVPPLYQELNHRPTQKIRTPKRRQRIKQPLPSRKLSHQNNSHNQIRRTTSRQRPMPKIRTHSIITHKASHTNQNQNQVPQPSRPRSLNPLPHNIPTHIPRPKQLRRSKPTKHIHHSLSSSSLSSPTRPNHNLQSHRHLQTMQNLKQRNEALSTNQHTNNQNIPHHRT